jgi:uncharacterized protein (DUF1499 family)
MGAMLLARVALLLAGTAMLVLIGSGPMYQLELLSLDAAYTGLGLAAAIGAAALLAGIATIVAAVRGRSVPHVAFGVASALLGIAAIAIPIRARADAAAAAPLHDVTTDLQHPPAFKILASDYDESPATLQRDAATDALQRRAYPDLEPLMLPVGAADAFEEVLETMNEFDWPVADASQREGRVEVTIRSPWFGFKDNLVIRLTPAGDSTRVDIRSVSRDGANDMGRNAEHIREFLAELRR